MYDPNKHVCVICALNTNNNDSDNGDDGDDEAITASLSCNLICHRS